MGYGSQTGQRGRPATGRASDADRKAAQVSRHSLVERGVECADWKRRRRLERDPARWLRYYLAEAYDRPFDEPHTEIVRGVMRAHETGGRFAVAAERGIGKSSVMYGMILYLALTGRRRFPVYLPWSAPPMRRGLSFWRSALAFNPRILADYRWFAAPFAKARGYSNRMPSLRWEETGAECGALLQVSDGMIVLPDNLGAIGGSTVNGNPRGMNLPLGDGSVLRPDLALVDDPQDRKVAKSTALTTETCVKINGDIGGLGGAGAAFPLLLSGNCIAADDVMSRYIADPQWRALRISCVEKWPDGWADKGPAYRLWAEWWDEFRNDAKAGVKFYKANRPAMTQGMKLSAPHAYADKRDKTLPDALCVAMRQYWQMGHEAFMAERQQTPLSPDERAPFALTVPLICSREDDSRGPHEKPGWVKRVLASTDINDYALSTVILGFGNDQTCAVLWYGVYDNGGRGVMDAKAPEAVKVQQLFDALCRHGEQLGAAPSRPAVWAIDAGYLGQTVRRYADTNGRRCGMAVMLCRGLPGGSYRPGFKAIGRPGEECHETDWAQIGRGLAWNAHYWREVMQRAWLGDIGRPGSCSLFRGEHRGFAEQIWRERLLGRGEVGGKQVWTFASQPGRHDYGDAMAQGYAAAAWGGIGTGGAAAPKEPVRARVVIRRHGRSW
jgi:hypothetical protein